KILSWIMAILPWRVSCPASSSSRNPTAIHDSQCIVFLCEGKAALNRRASELCPDFVDRKLRSGADSGPPVKRHRDFDRVLPDQMGNTNTEQPKRGPVCLLLE